MTEVVWWQVPIVVHHPPRPWPAVNRLAANARLSKLVRSTCSPPKGAGE